MTCRRRVVWLVAAAVVVVPAAAWAQRVVCPPKQAPTSLVRIENDGGTGGTGVVIARGPGYAVILTARHVIAPNNDGQRTFWVHFAIPGGRRLPARFTDQAVLIFPPLGDVDVAMFRLDGAVPEEVAVEDPFAGEFGADASFIMFGFPNARAGVLCAHEGKLLRTAGIEVVINAQVESGVSGGPVFLIDPQGGARRLAGIVSNGDGATTAVLDVRQIARMVANTPDARNGGKPYPWPRIELKNRLAGDLRVSPLVQVQPGQFLMGGTQGNERFPADQGRPAGPRFVTLPAFFISQQEVTVEQYQACVRALKCTAPAQGSNRQDRPVTGVTWHDARAYAGWLDNELRHSSATSHDLLQLLDVNWRIDLPSEEEWEKAARLEGSDFPWGTRPDQRCANYNTDELRAVGASNRCASYAYGLADMAGNAREWTRSLMLPYPYDASKAEDPSAAGPRVVRGGSAKRIVPGAERVRSANREALDPNTRDEFTGFRVVLVCKENCTLPGR